MPGGSASKRKGSAFERDVVHFLVDHGFPYAERAYGAGRPDDVGDIDGVLGFCLEAKAHKQIDLAGFVDEATREAKNADSHRPPGAATYGAAVIKRRGKGTEQAYVVLELRDFARLVKEWQE